MTETSCELEGCGVTAAPLGWMPPRYAWALLGLGALAHVVLPVAIVARYPLLGIAAIAVGLWMAVGSKRRFEALGLALPPAARPALLLTDGWYAWSRNPMYVGIALVLLGAGLVLGSVPSLLAGPAFVLLVRHWFVPVEEEALARAHGEQWTAYERRVPRWL